MFAPQMGSRIYIRLARDLRAATRDCVEVFKREDRIHVSARDQLDARSPSTSGDSNPSTCERLLRARRPAVVGVIL